jgi:penicillin-binding protein 1A
VAAVLLMLFIISGCVFLYSLYRSIEHDLPPAKALSDITHAQASRVYSVGGQLIGKYYLYDRTPVPYDAIPAMATKALVATEDARFYSHHGIDWQSLPRVLFKSILLRDESAGGGSTITQQLAKNLFPRKAYNHFALIKNKLREMIIAQNLERIYSKDEIITLYFNTVPFGKNAFGIQSAAMRYFHKDCDQLSVDESALLVGLLKATSWYDPVRHPERARSRRNTVLQLMSRAGYLTESQSDSLSGLQLSIPVDRKDHDNGIAPYFHDRLRAKLIFILDSLSTGRDIPYNLYTDGLVVRTTLDFRLQQYAEKAVKSHISSLQRSFELHWKNQKPPWYDPELVSIELKKAGYTQNAEPNSGHKNSDDDFMQEREMQVFTWEGPRRMKLNGLDSVRYFLKFLHTGFVVLDNQTGAIRAWVGGIDFNAFPYDHVHTGARRQVGSVFKPIVYAAAIEHGISPCDYIRAEQKTFSEKGKTWTPSNVDRQYEGKYSMEGGLMHSVNTVSVKILEETGIGNCIALARKMGIQSDLPPYPSIALGTPSISLLEMAAAYATFANGGMYNEPFAILSIEDKHGNVIWEAANRDPVRAMREETALMIREMLRGVVNNGTAAGLRTEFGLQNDMAGKTGTTQHNADGWFIATTPEMTAAAWVGAAYPSIRFRSTALGQGAKTALPIVGLFFKDISADTQYARLYRQRFSRPPNNLLRELDCEPFKEDFRLFEWLFGKSGKSDKEPQKGDKEGGFFKKIGSIFKKKHHRQ